jgi:hypothetical protein
VTFLKVHIEYTRGYRLALVTLVVTVGDLQLAKEASPPGYIANRPGIIQKWKYPGFPVHAASKISAAVRIISIKPHQTTRLQRASAILHEGGR